jgi:hypothetical protein
MEETRPTKLKYEVLLVLYSLNRQSTLILKSTTQPQDTQVPESNNPQTVLHIFHSNPFPFLVLYSVLVTGIRIQDGDAAEG